MFPKKRKGKESYRLFKQTIKDDKILQKKEKSGSLNNFNSKSKEAQ